MRSFRFVALFAALAFFLPACGLSSPTEIPADDVIPAAAAFGLDEGEDGDEDDCVEEDGEIKCGLGGFLGSGS